MSFLELVRKRRSIRTYNPDRKLTEEHINYIIESGRLAPSAANRQAWEFILISSEDWLNKVRPCYNREWFHQAPHILIVKGNKDFCWTRSDGYNSIETDLTIAMDHMILAAADIGVGSCWIAAFNYDFLRSALQLEPHEEIFAITPLGYSQQQDQEMPKNRKKLSEILTKL